MHPWANVNALYQVYPRSYQDTNSDGIGDIEGIISRLDYIKTLADAIWISPLYQSPQMDFGYDISDYTALAPEYGSLEDFDRLISEAHARNIKLLMDFVPNHTSDQHAWFKESRSSRDNPKRDWYVWRDGKNGAEPNNWVSLSGGKSWEFDELTGQYYLHSWLKNQPDLNWQNPEVRDAMHGIMRFWLDRGVDGFRVDAVWVLSKDEAFADDPLHPEGGPGGAYGGYAHTACRNGAHFYEYIKGMAGVVAEYTGLLVLEYYSTWEFGASYPQLYSLQSLSPAACTTFFFDPLHWDFNAATFGQGIADYLSGLPKGALPVFCFGNHDQTRIVTHFGGESQARLIATLQLTLPGMPCLYYGEEIGMEDGIISPEQAKDRFGSDGAMDRRDAERTPMQWNAGKGAGFTEAEPWLPLAMNVASNNVDSESRDSASFLALYRALLSLRRTNPALRNGQFTLLGYLNNVLAYQIGNYTVYVNFNAETHRINIGDAAPICSSLSVNDLQGAGQQLQPYEALVVKQTGDNV